MNLSVKSKLWREVATVWNLEETFVGSYREDYQIIQNKLLRARRAHLLVRQILDHNIKSRSEMFLAKKNEKLFTMQAIPDYVRWLQTGGEMHYLPFEKLQRLQTQVVDNTPSAFLPSNVLEMSYKVFPHGVEKILSNISFISWCTDEEVKTFFSEFEEKLDKSFANDRERAEYWSQDQLYREKKQGRAAGAMSKARSVGGRQKNRIVWNAFQRRWKMPHHLPWKHMMVSSILCRHQSAKLPSCPYIISVRSYDFTTSWTVEQRMNW